MRALHTLFLFSLTQGRLTPPSPVRPRPGRRLNLQDYMSPVDYAVRRGDTTILSELLSSGPSLDSDGIGYSALSLAVEREQTKASHEHVVRTSPPVLC